MAAAHTPTHRAQALVDQLAPRTTAARTPGGLPASSSSSPSSGGARVNNESTTYSGEFAYTLDPSGLLTAEQRRSYDENGFLLIKKLVSQGELDVWRERFVGIANGDIEPTPTMTVMRDVAVRRQQHAQANRRAGGTRQLGQWAASGRT